MIRTGGRPSRMIEIALSRSDVAAAGIFALNGALVATALALRFLVPWFTLPLGVLLGLLLGPPVAFALSSLYARIEQTVGRRLGGRATLDDLYRLAAWSFLPLGVVALLYGSVGQLIGVASHTLILGVSLLFALLGLAVLGGYVVSVSRLQGFSWLKGAVSVSVSLLLTLTVLGGAASGIWLSNYFGLGPLGWISF